MGTPFIGEIRMFGGNFAPRGWAFCNGQLLSIAENSALFSLIGTTYGGDGQTTFALPDLQCRIPMHQGNSHIIGEKSGSESVTLTTNQIAVHNHSVLTSTQAATNSPQGAAFGANGLSVYRAGPPSAQMAAVVSLGGGSQPHDNMMPFLVISFIISLEGIFPSQN
jgi:microcystin-dependent protein